MLRRTVPVMTYLVLLAGGLVVAGALSDTRLVARQAAATDVPANLRPLVVAPQSEIRLVVRRYTLDRQTLDGNYAGAAQGGRGGGRGGRGRAGQAAPEIVPISPARLSRLKRFDLSWQDALAALDAARLTEQARTDLAGLRETVATNLAAIEVQHAALQSASALVPFRQTLVDLIEARMRVQEMNAERAAGVLDAVTKQMAAERARLEALPGSGSGAVATRAALVVDLLRRDMDEWFGFYNGYDPMFTWWMGVPYKEFSEALTGYGEFLRTRTPDAGVSSAGPVPPVEPSPAQKYGDVPDLAELIALPQDELAAIVNRFRAGGGQGGGRGLGNRSGRSADDARRWLEALKTLDFDRLSRNAQINYLFIRRTAQLQLERAGITLPANPPRKTDDSGIPGDARGRQGLIWDLTDEVIPYTPEELIRLADQEFAWVENEMKKASRDLGFGDDWKRAVEHTKNQYPPPGGQPVAVRDMLHEAIDYLRAHDLVTVPQVAAESLPMIMMTPERQLVNPFFTGGTRISVSYPTDTMTYTQRLQSMRGNNYGFSHAVAHHEMIPGHNLVFFTDARFDGYRADLGAATPFFGEGWALYWELLLWDRGFNDTPEERIGALFWRMHRCARIVFSLRFHMGEWSPQEAIDFLVDRVGHERENATAEVRRSFQGDYGPLYQMAYLLGGIQIRSLHRELVESGRMTAKAFHDEMLRQGSMPIALLRLATSDMPLTPDMNLDWKFFGEVK